MAGEKWSVLLPWWQHGRDTWNHFPYHVPDHGERSDSRSHTEHLLQSGSLNFQLLIQRSIVVDKEGN